MDPSARRSVLVAAILGSAMVFIDGTVVNVALPSLQRTLGARVAEAQWTVEIYTLFLASLMLVGGSLGDHFGRRRIFALGVALFAASSVWCGLAPGVGQLIVARGVQGMAGALLTPGSLSLITALFPEKERGHAIGVWSAWSGVATAAGPVVGGWLIDRFSWRWAFFINVPMAVVVLALVFARVPESRAEHRARRLDLPGAALVTLGLGGVVYGLLESSRAALSAGAVALAAFVLVERRVREPLVPPALFRSPAFTGANLLTLLLYGALGGSLFYLPFNLIQVHGYRATEAGAALLPFIALVFVLSPRAGKLADRRGPRLPLLVGPSVAGAGFALMALPSTGGSYWTTFFPAIVVLGIGMGLTIAPLTTTVMTAADPSHAGLASGINNAVSRAAGMIAIAVLGVAVITTFNRRLDQGLADLDLPPAAREAIDQERSRLAAIELPDDVSPSLRARVQREVRIAYVAGFRVSTIIAAALALASAGMAALFLADRRRRRKSPSADG